MARLPAGLVLLLALTTCVRGEASPQISFADDVPADFRGVATDAWSRFTTALEGRSDCVEPVRVRIAWNLGDRAAYDPATGVVVRVPGTAANLRASLVHEFAHHLERTCPAHRALRPDFLRASSLAEGVPWFAAQGYEDVPSERFAEAVVVAVLGRPSGVGVPTPPAAVDLVQGWAAA